MDAMRLRTCWCLDLPHAVKEFPDKADFYFAFNFNFSSIGSSAHNTSDTHEQ